MASIADENSPPRLDSVAKAKMQSSLVDSPSRVTRSQLRRLSNAPAEAPMSPKPNVTRRRSTFVSESRSDLGAEDEASNQEEPDAVKPQQRSRRSTRRSFADVPEDNPPVGRGNKLSSIKEDSKPNVEDDLKPATRRTRASLRAPIEPEPEVLLPTRRTRRSSISSISSVTSNIVSSPRRQTRSRKNLSPVPSPTFSEVSTMSEIPETSPNAGKRRSGTGLNTSSTSITPHSSHVSPAVRSSGKNSNPASASRSKDSSPINRKSEVTHTAVRQLLVDIEDATSTKRSSLSSPVTVEGQSSAVISPNESESLGAKPARRSQGRLSLSPRKSSPFKFVESDVNHDNKLSNNEDSCSENSSSVEDLINKSQRRSSDRRSLSSNQSSPALKVGAALELSQSRRSSLGRLSLSSNKSSPAKLPAEIVQLCGDDTDSAASSAPYVVLTKSEDIDELNSSLQSVDAVCKTSVRESSGRQSWKSSPLKFTKTPVKDSPKKSQPEEEDILTDRNESSDNEVPSTANSSCEPNEVVEVSRRSSVGRMSLSSTKSTPAKRPSESEDSHQVSHNESRRSSLRRLSLTSNSSTPNKPSGNEDSTEVSHAGPRRDSAGRLSLASNKSTPAKTAGFEESLQVSHTEPRRDSTGRLSLASNKSTPAKTSGFEESLQVSQAEPRRDSTGRLSLASNKSTPAKTSGFEESLQVSQAEPQRDSTGRLSLASNKSTPAKISGFEESLQVSQAEPRRDSTGRLSLASNKSTPAKTSGIEESSEVSPQVLLNECQGSTRRQVTSIKSTPKKLSENEVSQVSHIESRRNSAGRLSLASNKSTPDKICEMEGSPVTALDDSRSSLGRLSSSKFSSAKLPFKLNVEDAESTSPTNFNEDDLPNCDLNATHQSSSAPTDDSTSNDTAHEGKEDADPKESASFKFPSSFKIDALSKRASTGNIRAKTPDAKSKPRASMGPLINPLIAFGASEDGGAISDSSDSSANGSLTIVDEKDLENENLTISPIKHVDTLLKRRSLTPSSDKSSVHERQHSPNNAFEKSTVFDDANESFGSTSESFGEAPENLNSSCKSLNLSQESNKNNTTDDAENPSETSEQLLLKEKTSPSPLKPVFNVNAEDAKPKLPRSPVKVYKDAAFLLSGGNISDFEDDDSDDQWQLVLTPSTKSKKELRLEKKLLKKAEKQAKKTARQEKLSKSDIISKDHSKLSSSEVFDPIGDPENVVLATVTTLDVTEDREGIVESSLSQNSKRKSSEGKPDLFVVEDSSDYLQVVDVEEPKKRKSLPKSDGLAPMSRSSTSPIKTDTEVVLSSKKSNKRKSRDAESGNSLSDSFNLVIEPEIELLETEEVPKLKKRKSLTQSDVNKINLVLSESAQDETVLDKQKGEKREANANATPDEIEAQISKASKVLKKKKSQKLVNGISDNGATDENSKGSATVKIVKKKKKKAKKQTTAEENTVPEDNLKPKKKKLKALIDEPTTVLGELPLVAVAKEKKLVLDSEGPIIKKKVNISQDTSKEVLAEKSTILKEKKKLKKPLGGETIANAEVSEKLSIKKSKKMKTVNGEILSEAGKNKKLKRKAEAFEPITAAESNAESIVGDASSNMVQTKKRKLKKLKAEVDNDAPIKKRKKKVALLDDENPEVASVTDLKKKKKKVALLADENPEVASVASLKKKKKKKALVEVDENVGLNSQSADLITVKKIKKRASAAIEIGNASDSDDAPTSISFSSGKNAALAELEAAASAIKSQKELKRLKMERKMEKIRQEKLAKLQKLNKSLKHNNLELDSTNVKKQLGGKVNNIFTKGPKDGASSSKIYFDDDAFQKPVSKRLPSELLESLSEQRPNRPLGQPNGSKEEATVPALSAEEKERLQKKLNKKIARKLEKQKLLQSDYVPLDGVLGATRFGVVPLRNVMLAKKREKNRLAEEAVNFRQQSLFGNRIRRTPISSVLAHQDKLKASGKNHISVSNSK